MGFHGISCDFMGFHVISWDFMDLHGISWIFMGFHGSSWDFMDLHGISWIFMGFHVRFWFDLCFFVQKKLGNVFPIFFGGRGGNPTHHFPHENCGYYGVPTSTMKATKPRPHK